MAKAQPVARAPDTPAHRFRGQIEAAVADGVSPEEMILRLTLRDTHLLSRDRTTPLDDISYADGVMRYLGVRVEKGGVPDSILDRGAAAL